MKTEIPTENDWGDYKSDMDQKDAYEIFYGRTNTEMHNEYRKHITARTTDLKFMPKIPFKYYMLGFNDFVVSNQFDRFDAPDVAYCFITLVEEKLRDTPDFILPIMDKLINTVEYIANHQEEYGADTHIYGNFKDKLKLIRQLFTSTNARKSMESSGINGVRL